MKIKCKNFRDGLTFKYAHMKRDGMWLEVTKNATGRVTCLSSNPTDLTEGVKHCGFYGVAVERLPAGTTLYGELWAPGCPASEVKSLIAKRQPLQFDCFAIATEHHNAPLEQVSLQCTMIGQRFAPFIWLDDTLPVPWNAMNLRALPPDVEGYVFKNGNLADWHKWKPVRTADLVVKGFKDGRGRNLGLIGSLICALADGTVVADVGGMDDATRITISDNEEEYLGKVVEVAYQYVGSGGRLRHPRFIRFRDDKYPYQCTGDQLS